MIRLALVITELDVGGAEKCLAHLATRIDKARFAPVVYSLKARPAAGKDSLVEQLKASNIPTHFLGLRSSWQSLTAVRTLTKMLREQRPHVVQNFLFHANVVGTLAAAKAHAPHIAMGMRVADPRPWRVRLERALSGKVGRVVCVSQSVADFCESRGFSAEKLAVIANGVDVERFKSALPMELQKLGVPAGRRVLVFVGRLDEQKGLVEFFELLPSLLNQLPQHDLLLVGEGPLRAPLGHQAQRLGIDSRVHFAGWQSDIPAILAASEMLVLPSKWEGMPNVVLEAMAAGMPIAATRAEGVVEVLGDLAEEQTALSDDLSKLTQIILQMSQNSQLSEKLGLANQSRVSRPFSLEAMVSRYEALYASLAGGRTD